MRMAQPMLAKELALGFSVMAVGDSLTEGKV